MCKKINTKYTSEYKASAVWAKSTIISLIVGNVCIVANCLTRPVFKLWYRGGHFKRDKHICILHYICCKGSERREKVCKFQHSQSLLELCSVHPHVHGYFSKQMLFLWILACHTHKLLFRSLITELLESSCQAEDIQKLHFHFLCLDRQKLRLLERMTQTPTWSVWFLTATEWMLSCWTLY